MCTFLCLSLDMCCASPQHRRTSLGPGPRGSFLSLTSPTECLLHKEALLCCSYVILTEQTEKGAGCEGRWRLRRRKGFTINILDEWARGGNTAAAAAYYTPSVGNLLVWVPSEKGKLCYLVTLSSWGFASSVLSGSHSGLEERNPYLINVAATFI